MARRVKELMLPLSEYAVVDEDATVLRALEVLRSAQARLTPGRQPHRAVLVRNRRGEIVGKVHYFAFLRALVPERGALQARGVLDIAGVGDDLRESSMRMLDFLTGDLIDLRGRAASVRVRDVCAAVTASIDENASVHDAIARFTTHQTHSLLVRRKDEVVGLLRLSDLFDEISREILASEPLEERP